MSFTRVDSINIRNRMNRNERILLCFRAKMKEHSNTLHFDSYYLDEKSEAYPLYPYHSIELSVIFLYGTDFERHMNILLIPGSIETLAYIILLFVSSAAIILCIIRRKLKLRRDGLISTFIDTVVAFVAGGNLQMKHKLERLFFAVMLIAAFFITSIFAGSILFYMYRILNQKIDTFKLLDNVNSPIYINQGFGMLNEDVHQKLRFVITEPLFDVIVFVFHLIFIQCW